MLGRLSPVWTRDLSRRLFGQRRSGFESVCTAGLSTAYTTRKARRGMEALYVEQQIRRFAM
eukprot:6106408-Pyramimonas_sp.AAC.1